VKEIQVRAFDDLDWTEKQERNEAATTVSVGLDGRWIELDLTQPHATELVRFLDRYMTAGHKPERPPVLRHGSGPRAGARQFGKDRLAWVNANGWPEVTTRYMPTAAKKAYEKHLQSLAEAGEGAR